MVVEDNDEITEAFAMLLEQAGYAVVIARDGGEALMFLQTVDAHVIILDLMLAGMDGFTFREEQLGDTRLATIPVIVVSAGGLAEERKATALGMRFFRKPVVELDGLMVAIREACDPKVASPGQC